MPAPGHKAGRWQVWELQPRLAGSFSPISWPLRAKPACGGSWRPPDGRAFWGVEQSPLPASCQGHPVSHCPQCPDDRVSPLPRPEKGHAQTPPGYLNPLPCPPKVLFHSRCQLTPTPAHPRTPNNPPWREMSEVPHLQKPICFAPGLWGRRLACSLGNLLWMSLCFTWLVTFGVCMC